jgi:alkylhydroperoxidase/carboxymuconolactone decarboxylase family protein YurZ
MPPEEGTRPRDEGEGKERAGSVGRPSYTGKAAARQFGGGRYRVPDLAPRDRSLVAVSALIASGQVAQIPYHLNRAMDNGLTQAEAGEVITHLAFYVGWPNAFSALPVAKDVLEKRVK